MTQVISITERIARQPRRMPVAGMEAAILLFTGTRYERYGEAEAAQGRAVVHHEPQGPMATEGEHRSI